MQMEIMARHFTLGEEQREVITAALEKLEKFSPRPVQDLQLSIVHDAGRFAADAVLRLKSQEFRARSEEREPELAANEVVENLRKQLAKFKGKVSAKQKGEVGGLGRALAPEAATAGGSSDRPQGFVLRDMDLATAQETFQSSTVPFLVFRNVASSRLAVVYRRDDGGVGHMESQEG